MHAVVVGGAGFIGGWIVDELLRRGTSVDILDIDGDQATVDQRHGRGSARHVRCDVRDVDELCRAMDGADETYHLAGILGTSELNLRVRDSVVTNILGSTNVYEAAVRTGTPRVVNAAKPNVWRNAYSVTKEAAEHIGLLYDAVSATSVLSLRYFNAFGPHQRAGPVRKMLPTFAIQARLGLPISVFGSGRQTVDLIYVGDLARLTVDAARSGVHGVVPDCGSGVARTVLEVARFVNSHFGNGAGTEHLEMRAGEADDTELVADTTQLESIVGDLGLTDLDTALVTTLDWYERAIVDGSPTVVDCTTT